MTDLEFRTNGPQLVREFLRYHVYTKGHSARTANAYCSDLHHFVLWLHEHDGLDDSALSLETVRQIRRSDVYEYMMYLSEVKKNSAVTQKRVLSAIKSFFHYLEDVACVLEPTGIYTIEPPKARVSTFFEPKILEKPDIRDIQNIEHGRNDRRDHMIVSLFLSTGMRLSELTGLDLSSIDLKKAEVTVLGKGNKVRKVYLGENTMAELRDYLTYRTSLSPAEGHEKALFLSERGTRLSGRQVETMVKKRLKAAGLDAENLHVHSLRHSVATQILRSGKTDLETVSETLGHSSVAVTSRYLHSNVERRKEAAEELDKLL